MVDNMQDVIEDQPKQHTTQKPCEKYRPPKEYTWQHEILDNLPYILMTILGAAILILSMETTIWKWLSGGLYIMYSIIGAFCIILFVCPYCHLYDTRMCPCGYGHIAAKLRPRKDMTLFKQKFKTHIPTIVPLWFIPLLAGGIGIYRNFNWILLGLTICFVLVSFVILPLVARIYGCGHCQQKENCPWMK